MKFSKFRAVNPKKPGKVVSLFKNNIYSNEISENEERKLNTLFTKVVFPYAKDSNKRSIDLQVESEFPVACGMNSSGAISACLAIHLVTKYLDFELFCKGNELGVRNRNEVIHALAWMIENCFHSQKASGIGSSVALTGRAGERPVFYCSQKRTQLSSRKDDDEWIGVHTTLDKDGLKRILNLRRFVLDPNLQKSSVGVGYPKPPELAMSVIFSGNIAKTADVLKGGVRRVDDSLLDVVKTVQGKVESEIPQSNLRESIRFHMNHVVNGALCSTPDERPIELAQAFHELVCDSIGRTSILMMNSMLYNWRLVPQAMRTNQSLLDSAEVTNRKIREIVSFTSERCKKSDVFCESAIKVTGSGGGGALLFVTIVDQCEGGSAVVDSETKSKIRKIHKGIANVVSFWKKAPVVFSSINYKDGRPLNHMDSVEGARDENAREENFSIPQVPLAGD